MRILLNLFKEYCMYLFTIFIYSYAQFYTLAIVIRVMFHRIKYYIFVSIPTKGVGRGRTEILYS